MRGKGGRKKGREETFRSNVYPHLHFPVLSPCGLSLSVESQPALWLFEPSSICVGKGMSSNSRPTSNRSKWVEIGTGQQWGKRISAQQCQGLTWSRPVVQKGGTLKQFLTDLSSHWGQSKDDPWSSGSAHWDQRFLLLKTRWTLRHEKRPPSSGQSPYWWELDCGQSNQSPGTQSKEREWLSPGHFDPGLGRTILELHKGCGSSQPKLGVHSEPLRIQQSFLPSVLEMHRVMLGSLRSTLQGLFPRLASRPQVKELLW